MNKLNPIKYIEDTLSHHPKTILLWMTEGIVIDGNRYIIKEFRLKDDKLYAVIANNEYNPEYFEVQLCPDEETLKRLLALVAKKEQVLESTRETITIKHGTNGTSETTKVDTNPQKVLEHENLISDSEYITLNHQTGENTTHIQTARLKAELDELYKIISSIGGGGGATHTIQRLDKPTDHFYATKHVVIIGDEVSGYQVLTTFVFECYEAETVLTGELKEELEQYVLPNTSKTNGSVTIKNDGTNMKLINSKPTLGENQQGTFTFYEHHGGSGGGDV